MFFILLIFFCVLLIIFWCLSSYSKLSMNFVYGVFEMSFVFIYWGIDEFIEMVFEVSKESGIFIIYMFFVSCCGSSSCWLVFGLNVFGIYFFLFFKKKKNW